MPGTHLRRTRRPHLNASSSSSSNSSSSTCKVSVQLYPVPSMHRPTVLGQLWTSVVLFAKENPACLWMLQAALPCLQPAGQSQDTVSKHHRFYPPPPTPPGSPVPPAG
jgi:hypothetical protein